MAFEMSPDLERNGLRHQDWNRIPHLFVLRNTRPEELVGIRERLKPCRFTDSQRAFLIG